MGSNNLLIGIVMIIIGCVLASMVSTVSTVNMPIYHFYSGLLMVGGITHIGDYFTKKSYAIYSNTYTKKVTVQKYLDF